MLVDCYPPEDVFVRVPEVAQQSDPCSNDWISCIERCEPIWGKSYRYTLVHRRHSTPAAVIFRMLLCKHLHV